MFRTVSVLCFIVTFVGVFIHWIISRPRISSLVPRRPSLVLRGLVFLFTLLFIPQKLSLAGAFRKLIYLFAMLCFVILFITGFYSKIIHGTTISGYWLMIHATAAPVFAICIAVLAVMWAHNCRLDKQYWPWLQRILQRENINKDVPYKHELSEKISFWLIVASAIPLILSIILSMFPFFGTYWQNLLADTHRYCAVFFATAVIFHTYLLILVYSKRMTK